MSSKAKAKAESIEREVKAIEDEAGIGPIPADGEHAFEDEAGRPTGDLPGALKKADRLNKKYQNNIYVLMLYARLLLRAEQDPELCCSIVKNIVSLLRKSQCKELDVAKALLGMSNALGENDLSLDIAELIALGAHGDILQIPHMLRLLLNTKMFSKLPGMINKIWKHQPHDGMFWKHQPREGMLGLLAIATMITGGVKETELDRCAKLFVNYKKTNKLSLDASFIYSDVLEKLGRYKAALDALEDLGEVNDWNSIVLIHLTKGRLVAGMGEHANASNIFKTLLETLVVKNYPENLSCFVYYLSCLLRVDGKVICETKHDQFQPLKSIDRKSSELMSDEMFDECMTTASNLVMKLMLVPAKGNDSHDLIHFCRLALLEVDTRKLLRGRIDPEEFMNNLAAYFQSFGHLACATCDILMFTDALTREDKEVLLNRFTSELQDTNDLIFLAKQTVIFKLTELWGVLLSLDVCDLRGVALSLMALYTRCLPLHELDDTEDRQTMAGEELITLLCNVFVLLFIRSQEVSYLIQAISVLEFGLSVRSSVSKYKILLVHLYSHLGAFSLASERYPSLGTSDLLDESVCHSLLPHVVASPYMDYNDSIISQYVNNTLVQHARFMFDFDDAMFPEQKLKVAGEILERQARFLYSYKCVLARLDESILFLQKQNTVEETKLKLRDIMLEGGAFKIEHLPHIQKSFSAEVESDSWWSPTPFFNYLLESFDKYSANNPVFGDGDMQNVRRESDKRALRLIDRRFALIQLIYLCIETSSSSINLSGFRKLLEAYSESMGFSLETAEKIVFEISDGTKLFQDVVPADDVNDLIIYAIFLNAFKLFSKDEVSTTYWELPGKLIKIYTNEIVESLRQVSWCPGPYIGRYAQMVMGSLSWHKLLMELASGWKNKEMLTNVILQSVESLRVTLGELIQAIREYEFKVISISEMPCESAKVCSILGGLASSLMKGRQLRDGLSNGLMISVESIESGIIDDLSSTISNFRTVSEQKLELLISLKSKMEYPPQL